MFLIPSGPQYARNPLFAQPPGQTHSRRQLLLNP